MARKKKNPIRRRSAGETLLNKVLKGEVKLDGTKPKKVTAKRRASKKAPSIEKARLMTQEEFEDFEPSPEELGELFEEDEEVFDDDDYEYYRGEWKPPVVGGRAQIEEYPDWDPEGDWRDNPKTSTYVYIGLGAVTLGGLVWYFKNKS